VDDFGTGYSSLTYLKKFPIDELKIDRSFIAGLNSNTGDAAIVASCIDLAHAVGIQAVAEGVETPGQVQTLKALGCDLAQGFHFSRPLPAPLLKTWLKAKAGHWTAEPTPPTCPVQPSPRTAQTSKTTWSTESATLAGAKED
jgi:EAL domain-containing protein (putative c-di-GMP-specific phosphodiesterase class I)